MKKIYKSKVFWVAIIQGVLGAVLLFDTDTTTYLGVALIIKSVTDVVLRFMTNEPIG